MKSPVAATLVVVLLGVAVIAGPTSAADPQRPQEPPPPIFRVQVDAVEIDASVTDADGNPVTDLTADDFEILEDGRRQAITSFTLVNIPIERLERPLYSPTAIEPDVHTNQGEEGRLYVIALDEVRPDLALRTRYFLRRFIEQHFAANDVGAVVYVGRGNRGYTQDFTSSRRLLLDAIDRFSGGVPAEALPAAAGVGEAGAAAIAAFRDARQSESEFLTRARMRSLKELSEFVSALRGRRKAILYVTERLLEGTGLEAGEGVYGVLDYNGGARSIAFGDLHAALTAATRGNVSIYPVDPTGLSPGGALGDAEVAAEPAGSAGLNRTQELRALAEATGGFAVVNSNSYDAAFDRIVRENSAYYVLGFTSTNDRRDGRFRRVQVRVRRPGLQVRARNGYVAPLGRAPRPEPPDAAAARLSPAVADSLSVPLENASVPMAVFAAPFKGSGRDANVLVALEFDASRLGLVESSGTAQGEIEVATVAIAAAGKVYQGDRHRFRLALRPETYKRALGTSVRVLTQLALPPGRYQVRVAGGNVNGPAGSVMADLEVPDFTRQAMVMSGVALTSVRTAEAFTATAKNLLSDLLPAPATAVREFARGDTIALYAEVYENLRARAAHTVSLKAVLRTDDGRVIQTVDEDRSSADLQGASGGYGFRAELPLDVDPGLYVLHVEARANIEDQPLVTRDIQIRVK